MSNKFLSIMELIGKDALKALAEVAAYLPKATTLAELIFPAEAAPLAGVVNSVELIQNAVVMAEQKMAAAGKQTGTGTEKSADVLALTGPIVTDLLTKEGLHVDPTYIQKIIDAVVGVLNVRSSTVAA